MSESKQHNELLFKNVRKFLVKMNTKTLSVQFSNILDIFVQILKKRDIDKCLILSTANPTDFSNHLITCLDTICLNAFFTRYVYVYRYKISLTRDILQTWH